MKYTILALLLVAAAAAAWYGYALAHRPERVGTYATSSEVFQGKCIRSLEDIAKSKSAWAHDHHKPTNAVPTDSELFGPTGYLPEKPVCLKGGTYTIGAVSEAPRCSVPGHQLGKAAIANWVQDSEPKKPVNPGDKL
jgi:hypothetical protein